MIWCVHHDDYSIISSLHTVFTCTVSQCFSVNSARLANTWSNVLFCGSSLLPLVNTPPPSGFSTTSSCIFVFISSFVWMTVGGGGGGAPGLSPEFSRGGIELSFLCASRAEDDWSGLKTTWLTLLVIWDFLLDPDWRVEKENTGGSFQPCSVMHKSWS